MVSTWKHTLRALALAALVLAPGFWPPVPARAEGERLVLAFYYAWYDQNTWSSGKVPDVPSEPYVSSNPEVMARQIDQAKGAGIDAFVLNWWGQGNQTEKNLKALLDQAGQKGFRVAVDFDPNSPFMKGTGSYAQNLQHLLTVHASHPAYLRYNGRPVVFFYNVSRLGLSLIHISEPTRLLSISYAVFCLKKKIKSQPTIFQHILITQHHITLNNTHHQHTTVLLHTLH